MRSHVPSHTHTPARHWWGCRASRDGADASNWPRVRHCTAPVVAVGPPATARWVPQTRPRRRGVGGGLRAARAVKARLVGRWSGCWPVDTGPKGRAQAVVTATAARPTPPHWCAVAYFAHSTGCAQPSMVRRANKRAGGAVQRVSTSLFAGAWRQHEGPCWRASWRISSVQSNGNWTVSWPPAGPPISNSTERYCDTGPISCRHVEES